MGQAGSVFVRVVPNHFRASTPVPQVTPSSNV